mgnify:FL=1
MPSLNKVMLIGNVGKEPEIRYLEGNTPQATKVAQFTLATTERYRDRNGELHENTEWHNIVAWRGLADTAEKVVHKGTQLYIEGKLRTRSWTDQSGTKKDRTEIVVDNFQLLGKRSDNPGYQSQGGYQQAQTPYQQQSSYPAAVPSYQAPQPQAAQPLPQPEVETGSAGADDDLPF